jgi:hypothetical protein
MKYCILRAKKLSTFGSIAGSAKHTFREMAVPNADSSRTHLNWTSGAQSSAALCESIKTLLPAKRRKDAVLCIEYLITASPEWFKNSSGKEHLNYFNNAIAWLQKRHGASNIVCVNLQLDETTPHAVIYAVPRTNDGRLSAKDFLGGRAKLVAMQTEFWEQVGKPVGLQRGLEGSTAKHTTAKQYSAALAKNPSLLPPLRPEITFSDRISGRAKGLEEGHTEAVKEFAQLVTQARNEALLVKRARKERSEDLVKLRAERAQVQRLKREVDALTNENGHLRKKLRDQAERFAKQVEDFGIQLKQAAARYTHLLTATVLQKMQLKARDRNLGKKHLPISAADF